MTFRDDFQQLDDIGKLYSQAKPFTEAEKEKLVKAGKWKTAAAKKATSLEKAKAAANALLEASKKEDVKKADANNTDKYSLTQQILDNIERDANITHKPSSDADERYQQLLPYCQLAYLEENNGIPEEHARKLSMIFNDVDDALTYLKDNMKQNKQIVHDACLFQIPDVTQCDFETWKKLIKININDNEFRQLLPNAPEIEGLLKQNANTKITDEVRKEIQAKKQEIEQVNREVKKAKRHHGDLTYEQKVEYEQNSAKLSDLKLELYQLSKGVQLKEADKWILSACQEYNIVNSSAAYAYMRRHGLTKNDCIRFFELKRQNDDEKIPAITLDGAHFGMPGCYLMKVDVMDELQAARAACFGRLTKCCQSLSGEAGEPCTIHGLTSPNGGFYVVIDGDKNNPKIQSDKQGEEDKVLGQCWVWRGSDDAIVFDSVEVSGEAAKEPVKVLFNQLAKAIVNQKNLTNQPYAKRVLCGARSGLSREFGVAAMQSHYAKPLDYSDYRDSHKQRVIINPAAPYYFMEGKEGLQATEEWLKEILSKDDIQTKQLAQALNSACMIPSLEAMIFQIGELYQKKGMLSEMFEIVRDLENEIVTENILKFPCLIDIIYKSRGTPLMMAAANGHTAIIEKLIAAKADVYAKDNNGATALTMAVYRGHTAIVEKLIAAKADIDAKNDNGETVLMRAVYNGSTAIVEMLIAAKADIDAKDDFGMTALIRAAVGKHTAIVEKLIAAKADINTKDADGLTALMKASSDGSTAIVEMLIAAKADIDAKDKDGCTALIKAAANGNTTIVEMLIAAKADIDAKDNFGMTALMKATEYGYKAAVERLIESLISAGASIDITDNQGQTAISYAGLRHPEVVKILEKAQQQKAVKVEVTQKIETETKRSKAVLSEAAKTKLKVESNRRSSIEKKSEGDRLKK